MIATKVFYAAADEDEGPMLTIHRDHAHVTESGGGRGLIR